jgi:hypothetical protein
MDKTNPSKLTTPWNQPIREIYVCDGIKVQNVQMVYWIIVHKILIIYALFSTNYNPWRLNVLTISYLSVPYTGAVARGQLDGHCTL